MVFGMSALAGVKYAVVSVREIAPATSVEPCFMVNVAVVRVSGSMGILKVAETILFRNTPVALFAGLVEITMGDRVSPVLNVHT